MTMRTTTLQCPICRDALHLRGAIWQCTNLHSFDQSRHGYVNLHVVQHKHSSSPGDTEEAIVARHRFLKQGFYQPLLTQIQKLLSTYSIQQVLDIGCGEGYYTLGMSDVVSNVIGLDIAKSAIQVAAKSDHAHCVRWVVGTGTVLPVADESIEMCTSLFSPLPKLELLRVLKSQGYILIATPAPHHLYDLRAALFETVKAHFSEKILQQLYPEFELQHAWLENSSFTLDQKNLSDLLTMTPYAYRAKPERRLALQAKSSLDLQAAFWIYLLRKCC